MELTTAQPRRRARNGVPGAGTSRAPPCSAPSELVCPSSARASLASARAYLADWWGARGDGQMCLFEQCGRGWRFPSRLLPAVSVSREVREEIILDGGPMVTVIKVYTISGELGFVAWLLHKAVPTAPPFTVVSKPRDERAHGGDVRRSRLHAASAAPGRARPPVRGRPQALPSDRSCGAQPPSAHQPLDHQG